MSERDENSVSNRSLLIKANVEEIESTTTRTMLLEYQQVCSLLESEEKQLCTFNQLITTLSKGGNSEAERLAQYQQNAQACAKRISALDNQLFSLEATEALLQLLNTLKREAYAEAEEAGRMALEEYRLQAIEHQKQVIQEWEKSRREAEAKWRAKHNQQAAGEQPTGQKRTQKRLAKVEEEIAEIRPKVDALFEEINKLRWCWFGKKKIEKEKLKFELSSLQSELSSLYQEKYRLKNKLRK